MRAPRSLSVELTAECNLRCRYCYFFSNPAVSYHDLPTEEWLTFFAELGSIGVMDVTLAGGEPFLRADLPALIEGVVANRMRFSLLSNGGLVDDGIAGLIARTGRCDHVQISLDGPGPEAHDAVRGRGAFEGAVRGIRTLQRHGVRVAVRVTLHRGNVRCLPETARFLLEELGLPAFSTNAAGYLGACQGNARETLLTTEDRQEAMEALLRLERHYPGRISAQAGPLSEGRMWAEMERHRARGAPRTARGGRLTACGCVFSKLAVRSDGVLVPCTMLAHLPLGRINRDRVADVWRDHPTLARLRERSQIPLADFAHCDGCPYTEYCTGNCPALAYSLTGEVDHPSPDACLRDFLAAGGHLPAV